MMIVFKNSTTNPAADQISFSCRRWSAEGTFLKMAAAVNFYFKFFDN